jgi:hypothetical protein
MRWASVIRTRIDAIVLSASVLAVVSCGAPPRATAAIAAPSLVDRSGPAQRLRSVAWSARGAITASNRTPAPAAEPVPRGVVDAPGLWSTPLDGQVGPIAARADQVIATEQSAAGVAAVVMIDAATGRVTRRIAVLATDFVVIADVARCDSGTVLAGSFGGTLRVGERGVSTGGGRDGFVAKLDGSGTVTALTRMGGEGDDGFATADCRGDDVAVAGTFSAGAELRGVELPRIAEKSPGADAMVALLRGESVVWQRTFGSSSEDLAADLAISDQGDIAVVGIARGTLHVGDVRTEIDGAADGYLARWTHLGAALGAIRIGGADYDAITKVAALGDRLVLAGFFSGTMELAGHAMTARGGDDAMLVVVDRDGAMHAVAISGDGREEIVALETAATGVVIGVTHSAGFEVFGLRAAAPADPLGGAAILVVPAL